MPRTFVFLAFLATGCGSTNKASPTPTVVQDSALDLHKGAPADVVCDEPQRWAVGRAGRPISHNQIYTEGITYYIEWAGDSSSLRQNTGAFDALRSEINGAMANALTAWGSSLLLVRSHLRPELRAYVDSMNHCGTGMCLFQPPQAVEMDCRKNAALIIRVYAGKLAFPLPDTSVVALAQIEGRTILLEAHHHDYVFDPRLFDFQRGRDINLMTVLAHELGHSFGLRHVTGNVSSIMHAGPEQGFVAHPTVADADSLAASLGRDIVGSAPGIITATGCSGLHSTLARSR